MANITLRRANQQDVFILLDWKNDPRSLAQSLDDSPISMEEHKQWFSDRINSETCKIFIAEIGAKPIGVIRFEWTNDHWISSWVIAPDERGKGFSTSMIKLGLETFNKPVKAIVKHTNSPSLKAALKAGFNVRKDDSECHELVWQPNKNSNSI